MPPQRSHLVTPSAGLNEIIPSLAAAQTRVALETPAIEPQKTPVWCWASSIQNVLAHYGVRVTQEQVVKATYGEAAELTIFDATVAVMNLIRANDLVAPEGRVVHPFYVAGAPIAAGLVDELENEKSPVLVF